MPLRVSILFLSLLVIGLVGGCSFERLSLEGLACECAGGWVCDESTQTCIKLERREAGVDASLDSGATDATEVDTPNVDVPANDVSIDSLTDTGTPDVAIDSGPDVEPDAGASPCLTYLAGATVCDDFEGGLSPVWTINSNVAPTPDSAEGTGAVEFDVRDMGVGALRLTTAPFSLGETVYLHALVRVSALSGTMMPHISLLQFRHSPSEGFEFAIRSGSSRFTASVSSTVVTASSVPTGEWFCFRAEIDLFGSPRADVRFFVDDAMLLSTSMVTTGDGSSYIAIGPQFTNGDGAALIRMDNVAIGTTPLPCN